MKPSRLAMLLGTALFMIGCTAPGGHTGDTPEAADSAANPGDAANAPEIAAAAEEDPVVCESIVRTGTRVAERRCMRLSDKEKQARGGQEALGEWQRRGTQVGNPTGQ